MEHTASTPLGTRVVRYLAHVGPLAALVAFGVPFCPVRLAFGKPCPGCGLTRAAFALVRGDVATATALNPLAVIVVPVAAALVLFASASYLFDGKTRLGHPVPAWVSALSLVALYVVWMARWFGAFGGPVAV